MDNFTCTCGRRFDNIQSLRGHKSHCLQHLESTGKLSLRKQVDLDNKNKISKALKLKYQAERDLKAKQWEEEKHLCECCGIIMKTKYGSGRFCSRRCANARIHSDETKKKIGDASKKSYQEGLLPQLNNSWLSPNSCIQKAINLGNETRRKYDDNPNFCVVCNSKLPYERRNLMTCSDKCYHNLIGQRSSDAAKRNGGNLNPYGVRGTAKYGTYRGIHCDSSWELAYVIYCLDHNIDIVRNVDGFQYTYQDKSHMYYPDFIVGGEYIEVKNFHSEQVQCKIEQFPINKRLTVLFKEDMRQYISYCIQTYGKDYVKMYDKDKPSWMTRKKRNE